MQREKQGAHVLRQHRGRSEKRTVRDLPGGRRKAENPCCRSRERFCLLRGSAGKGAQVRTVGGMEITVTWIRADTFPLERWEIPL